MKTSRNVHLFGWVSLLTDVSSRMILPVLPLFLVDIGTKPYLIGLMESVSELLSSALKTVFGTISDRLRKTKIFIFAGYLLSNVVKPLMGFARTWSAAFAVRAGDRMGGGIRQAPRDALLANSVPKGKESAAFGFVKGMDKAGAVVGALLAFLILKHSSRLDYAKVFFLAAIPGLLGTFLVVGIRERSSHNTRLPRAPLRLTLGSFDLRFKLFILVAFLFFMADFSYMFILLRAKGMIGWGHESWTSRKVALATILIYVVFNLSFSFFSFFSGRISDRLTKWKTLLVGYASFAAMAFGFVFLRGLTWAWILIVVYGFTKAFVEPVSKGLVAFLTPVEKRGTALGMYNTAQGLGRFLGSPIAGFLCTPVNYRPAFYFAGVCAVAATLLLIPIFARPATQDEN